MADRIETLAALEALYGEPVARSLLKESPRLTPEYRRLIEASPFCALASVGPGGLDCSPRGDAPGFVRVIDDLTLAMPDRLGNNRIDTLRNIVVDPRVALLFLIPGVGETLRVNGQATISVKADLLASFAVDAKRPRSVILVRIDSVYFQCARAIQRSKLWDRNAHVERGTLPTAGEMTRALAPDFDAASYDAALPERQKQSLY